MKRHANALTSCWARSKTPTSTTTATPCVRTPFRLCKRIRPNFATLKDYPNYKLTIEGHCDERGSAEYNIVLGDARAKAAKDYLVQVGIPDGQMSVMSYGKEKQVCPDHTESCWQKNRRIHIVPAAG